ncbi:C40 family peptidase [Nesterenkonia halotolerans]|uniref:C40 family peptidase n=1 Tax=Nesterenkonia halotolerans TaxID=225325 RepID=UPI003EE58B29
MTSVPRRDRRRQARPSLAQAVAVNAGTMGRSAVAAMAASGLVITSGAAANASTTVETPEITTLEVGASGLSVDRASNTSSVEVTSSREVDLSFDRPVVTSTPAPEPEPEPEPAPEPEPVVEQAAEVVPASPQAQPEAPAEPEAPAQPAEQQTPAEPAEQEAPSEPVQQEQTQEAPQQQTQQADNGQRQQAERSESGGQSQGNTQVASSEPAQSEAPASNGGNGSIVGAAYAGLGNPYSFGGTSPSGWDCSGFINWAYAQAGVDVPRSTYAMMSSMRQVSSPSPGDIVIQNGGSHAAIYVGNGQLIGANNPRVGTVQYSLDSPYWSNTMYLSAN